MLGIVSKCTRRVIFILARELEWMRRRIRKDKEKKKEKEEKEEEEKEEEKRKKERQEKGGNSKQTCHVLTICIQFHTCPRQ